MHAHLPNGKISAFEMNPHGVFRKISSAPKSCERFCADIDPYPSIVPKTRDSEAIQNEKNI